MKPSYLHIFRILQIATVAVFAGRAYQHLFWDAPYRELFWDPVFMQWFIESFTSMKWGEYVTHPSGDEWFQRYTFAQGVFYLSCALVAVFIKRLPHWAWWVLVIGAADLIFLALIDMKDKFYHYGQFLEFTLQFSTPLFFYAYCKKEKLTESLVLWMKVAIALTFTCHGLYAIGYYPIPGSFMTMIYNGMGISGDGAKLFLKVAGIMDFIVSVAIFLPNIRVSQMALLYATLWGLATTLARIFGNFYVDYALESLHQWGFEAVYRFPHWMIPLLLLLQSKRPTNN